MHICVKADRLYFIANGLDFSCGLWYNLGRKEGTVMLHLLLAIIYISFISLGLPDALLGAAWPVVHEQFAVPVSWMGPISLIISAGTVISSLLSDRLTRRFGTGRVTAFSVAMTAVALLGFSFSGSYWMLCLWAIPYGLGAGSVDSSLNNYVAVHYASRHMSWLHCMWGVGAAAGPYLMGWVLTGGQPWNKGYLYIGILQMVLSAVLFISLPIWKTGKVQSDDQCKSKPLSFKEIFAIDGVKAIVLSFFCYCAFEQTLGQWASSYLVFHMGIAEEEAAGLAGLYFIGITVGRAANGFLAMKYTDKQLARLGAVIMACGVALLLLSLGKTAMIVGFLLCGLGSAPIYPCAIHATPERFGADRSQSIIGVEMACAYIGTCLMPPLFGVFADWAGIGTLPVVLGVILLIMWIGQERFYKQ